MSSIDQQFVEYVIKSLVSKPEAVQVERRIDEKGVLLELTVDPEDLGRVIGKRGATAQSLRTLLRALGTKNDARYNLKIVDNGPPQEHRQSSSPARSQDDDQQVQDTAVVEEASEAQSGTSVEDDGTVETPEEDRSDMVSKTRKELDELDDLDV